jgi:hypothetical protein
MKYTKSGPFKCNSMMTYEKKGVSLLIISFFLWQSFRNLTKEKEKKEKKNMKIL